MLPGLLMASEPGSFAEHTIIKRKPRIIADIIESNDYPPAIVEALLAFRREIVKEPIQPPSQQGPHLDFWRQAWQTWQGRTWRQLPWFFAESFFYQRVLETVRYFERGSWYHVDPFQPQKTRVLADGLEILRDFVQGLGSPSLADELVLWLRRSLWGNRVDLSNITVDMSYSHSVHGQEDPRLLVDDTSLAREHLVSGTVKQLDWIADNSGLELLSDLGMIDFVLEHELVSGVRLHLKEQPFFVSDAMIKDVAASIDALSRESSSALRAIGQRLAGQMKRGRLVLTGHPFWSSCLFFTQFPDELRGQLAQADMLVLKGDANYRRLVQDRHWPATTHLADITAYMPAPFLVMRTLKSEVMVDLPPGRAAVLTAEDPNWLINGERGLVQYVAGDNAQASPNQSPEVSG